jgi:hypothetical protein
MGYASSDNMSAKTLAHGIPGADAMNGCHIAPVDSCSLIMGRPRVRDEGLGLQALHRHSTMNEHLPTATLCGMADPQIWLVQVAWRLRRRVPGPSTLLARWPYWPAHPRLAYDDGRG